MEQLTATQPSVVSGSTRAITAPEIRSILAQLVDTITTADRAGRLDLVSFFKETAVEARELCQQATSSRLSDDRVLLNPACLGCAARFADADRACSCGGSESVPCDHERAHLHPPCADRLSIWGPVEEMRAVSEQYKQRIKAQISALQDTEKILDLVDRLPEQDSGTDYAATAAMVLNLALARDGSSRPPR